MLLAPGTVANFVYSSCLNFCPNGTCFLVLFFTVNDPIQCMAETIKQLVALFCDKA